MQISLSKKSKELPSKLLERFSNYQTLGQKKKIVKEKYNIEDDEEALERIKQYQSLQEFIKKHDKDIYKVEELNTALHRKGKDSNLTADEVAKIYGLYDELGQLKPQYNRELNPLEE